MFVHSLAVFFQRRTYRCLRISVCNFHLDNLSILSRINHLLMAPKKRTAATKTATTTTNETTVKKAISKIDKTPTKKTLRKKEVEKEVKNENKETVETKKVQQNGDDAASKPESRTRAQRAKAKENETTENVTERRKPTKRAAVTNVENEKETTNTKQPKTITTNKKITKKANTKKETITTEKENEEKSEEEEEGELKDEQEKQSSEEERKHEQEKESSEEEQIESPKVAKRTAKNKKKVAKKTAVVEEEAATTTEKTVKRGRGKKTDKKPTKNDENTLKNTTTTKWPEIDFKTTRLNTLEKPYNIHIQSWNVDGIRAWIKKSGLEILKYAQPDIFCIQETKCSVEKLPEEIKNVENYKPYWSSCKNKEGYSGVGILTKIMPIEVHYGIDNGEFDNDGRCITAEFKYFYLINVYVPNAGSQLVTLPKRLKWNKAFKNYIKTLDAKKPIIVCGDMNVAHNEIDLTNPKGNSKHAGFTIEEREGMTEFLNDGYIDTFRKFYPDKVGAYTFWTYLSKSRSKNVGWRLDYYLASERIMNNICDNIIHSEVYGSDHCPVSLYLNF